QAGQTLWETLVAQKVVNDEQILTALSTRFRLKLADVKEVDLTVKEKVPEQLARRYQILPLRVTDSFLEIATANPFDLDAEKALAFATAREIRMQLLAPSKISEKLDEVYGPEKALDKLRQQMKIPRQAGLPLISRIKIMSSLDIADRLRPQDGRARVAVNGQPIDLRVSTLPAALGEKVVIRILDSRATVKTLDSLGLNPDEVESLRRLLENHEGILLVTGPTGSGKTTTLYSCINQIKSEGVDIGVEAYKIAAALRGVAAQRLMRRLCLTCKEVWMEAPPDRLKPWIPKGTPLYRAAGCPDCAMTGYRGRFSIIEVLTVTPEVERRIAAGEPAEQIAVAARRGGMKSLWDSGLGHVLKGESTVDELMRVVDVPQEDVPEPVPAQASRRPPGGVPGSRIPAEPPAAFAAPTAATAEPLAHFDLLEG